jgi:hypothetical protein
MNKKLKEDLILYAIFLAIFAIDVYFLITSAWYEILAVFAIIIITVVNFDKISDRINDMFRTCL